MKFHEVQTHTIISNHAYLGYALVFSKKWFDRLDEATQKVLIDSAREVTAFQREETARREEGYIKTIAASSSNLSHLPAEHRRAFEEATRAVHDEFKASIGAELLEKTYKKIEELRGS